MRTYVTGSRLGGWDDELERAWAAADLMSACSRSVSHELGNFKQQGQGNNKKKRGK
jgi:hypothetical protein